LRWYFHCWPLRTFSDKVNASTFNARVIVSTRSDLISSVVGAVGELKGLLHGCAPGPALHVVLGIREVSLAEPYLREKLDRGERLIGFGHRIYKARDPRAGVLATAVERSYDAEADGTSTGSLSRRSRRP